jgi:hypothetical protein
LGAGVDGLQDELASVAFVGWDQVSDFFTTARSVGSVIFLTFCFEKDFFLGTILAVRFSGIC